MNKSSDGKEINKEFWNNLYESENCGWDLGQVSPPIKDFIDTLENKNLRILIPGCGNSYEADYLLGQGFTDITIIDIAPTLIDNLCEKFKNKTAIIIISGDFFEHHGEYDLIIEQTFFCALPPDLRANYVLKMNQLLAQKGKIVGLLFNKTFESSPPFGGSIAEYRQLFGGKFEILKMDLCHNSFPKRANSELFIELYKK